MSGNRAKCPPRCCLRRYEPRGPRPSGYEPNETGRFGPETKRRAKSAKLIGGAPVTFRTSLLGREPRPEAMVSVSIRSISRCPGRRRPSARRGRPSARVSSGAPTPRWYQASADPGRRQWPVAGDIRAELSQDTRAGTPAVPDRLAHDVGSRSPPRRRADDRTDRHADRVRLPCAFAAAFAVTTDTPRPMALTNRQPIRYRPPATVDH
jgi:hypothetical protein